MQSETLAATAENAVARLHLRVAWLCGLVLSLEGYDIAAVGYAVPSLVDAWRVPPSGFAQALRPVMWGCCLGRSAPGYWAIGWVANPCCFLVWRLSAPSLSSRRSPPRRLSWRPCGF